ncbi:MAG: Gfo/Idh/MocA family oxidoreductase [Armatimonadetes bacterium]|nr:Gfo/Idh/MocA family oxidoreductase [Armatimonadota bacterium]
MADRPIALAVVGGRRGRIVEGALSKLTGRLEVAAICDPDPEVLRVWKERHPEIRVYTDYDRLLADPPCNAVFVASPLLLHASQSIKAMDAGMDVLCEVSAAQTMDDCWALVETVERTGRTYMMAENHCYERDALAVLNMVRQGVFGDLYYAEGFYLNDHSFHYINPDGSLHWWGQLRLDFEGNWYPTHALGPVAWWLDATSRGSDRLSTIATFGCTGHSTEHYLAERLAADHPLRKLRFAMSDSTTSIITTEQHKMIVLRSDWTSRRPSNTGHYALQGTKGAYHSGRCDGEPGLAWVAGESPTRPNGLADQFDLFDQYAEKYQHPRWAETKDVAQEWDRPILLMVTDFVEAVERRTPSAIDVYDSVAWSSITPLSAQSLAEESATIDIPDFARRRAG